MPQPTAPRSSPTVESATPQAGVTPPAKGVDLTLNKVIAGAGAAATSAVLGSFFGATGTVTGAALGSVASTVATTLYQRSLDRTRDTILARVRLTPGRHPDLSDQPTVQLTAPTPSDPATESATTQLKVEPALRRPRRFWLWAGATVLVFVIGLLVVTGLEWAKGSSLTTGQPGTSVGRVLTPSSSGDDENGGSSESTSETSTPTPEPTTEPSKTRESTTPSTQPTPTGEPGATDSNRERATSTGTATPRPTPGLRLPGLGSGNTD
jgi:hypothetical protein